MGFKPLFDRILVRPVTAEQSVAGLYIPDTSNTLKKGVVVAAGEGLPGTPMTVKAGQEIMFDKGDGVGIALDGEQLLIMKESAVWMNKI